MNQPNQIYQYSLLSALMDGVCNEGIPVSKLLSQGNHGVGTFERMDGELILLDDKVYQLRAGGDVHEASSDDQIPFAVATNFSPAHTRTGQALRNKTSLDELLTSTVPCTANMFVSYRIEGTFSSMTTRTIRGQEYPGQPLSELGDNQYVDHYKDVEGTVVGFRSPPAWQGLTVAGHHLHFISSDRARGGHVLDLSAANVTVGVAVASNVHIELPGSEEFNLAGLVVDDSGIRKVEG
ncbi:hypothetical protein FQN50_001034 [Emmonsiellopsis sp. PD_5]|nr:hypothetical protein FQN50_001034 [Emmonsiellopsis sp. PD_5]